MSEHSEKMPFAFDGGMAAWPLHWPGWRVRLRRGFRGKWENAPGMGYSSTGVLPFRRNLQTYRHMVTMGAMFRLRCVICARIESVICVLSSCKFLAKAMSALGLCLIPLVLLLSLVEAWRRNWRNFQPDRVREREPRIWSTLFEEGMVQWTSPD